MKRSGAHLLLAGLASFCGACKATSGNARLTGLDGQAHWPMVVAAGSVHVMLFTSHECPIANGYAPTLRDLASEWAGRPVRLFVIHVDPDLDAVAAEAHARAYELPGTILLDPCHHVVRAAGATRTPEAVVLDERGIVYRGRIDDQWSALGSRAIAASSHELRDAVDAALSKRPAPRQRTPVVGCALPEPRR